MAAIDKLYATRDQYVELLRWLSEHNDMMAQCLRPWRENDNEQTRAIALFTREQDAWLLVKCPITWVTDQIKEQYDWGFQYRMDASWYRCPFCGDVGSFDLDLDCDCQQDE